MGHPPKMDDPQSLNLYQYVGGNPLGSVDPDGHDVNNPLFADINGGDPMSLPLAALFYGQTEEAQDARSYLSIPVSPTGMNFIKGWEGWNGVYDKSTGRWLPKDDGFGNGTIGWGHNCGKCKDFKSGITRAQGDTLFDEDVLSLERSLNWRLGGVVTVQRQIDALADFAYEVRHWQKTSLIRKAALGGVLTMGDFTAYGYAKNKEGVWVLVRSILKRRSADWNVYANGVYDSSH